MPLHLAFGWATSVHEVNYRGGRRCRQRPATSSRGTSPNGYTMASATQALGVLAARVNLSEADVFGNHCVVAVSSFGSLIHTAVGSAGGSGGFRTKRSGCCA